MMIPTKRKRFAETFRNCPSLFTHSIFFRGENSFDSTKDVIFLKQANVRFATVVAGKFRELTGNIFVGFASFTTNQDKKRRKSQMYPPKTGMLKLTI